MTWKRRTTNDQLEKRVAIRTGDVVRYGTLKAERRGQIFLATASGTEVIAVTRVTAPVVALRPEYDNPRRR